MAHQKKPRRYNWGSIVALFLAALVFGKNACHADEIPREAQKYRRDLVRNAHLVWGLNAPVATFAAQIHQESRWQPDARSPFANGLAQFTPATADWIGDVDAELAEPQPFNPAWALRALVRYDKLLYDRAGGATACDSMWMALWAYNGGEGWVRRDKTLARQRGANVHLATEVEPFNAGRNAAAFKENRGYPHVILYRWQPLYLRAGWGWGLCS